MTLEHGGCQGKEDGRELERRRSEGAGYKNPDETLGFIGIDISAAVYFVATTSL